ncbi:hypothetical protein [Bosea sp. AS-1]|jgi:hypothetical protein|uniref:hypothetical protein n=1 Tax=Bosea sp. AS-1 TaxID=2015316 RepID=UPI0012FD0B6B|nr:hypothetical protein [Bosea sp. AS-1]
MSSCLRQLRRESLPSRRPESGGPGGARQRSSTLVLAVTAGLVAFVLVAWALAALFAGA